VFSFFDVIPLEIATPLPGHQGWFEAMGLF
jgi:hypothetical protein